MPQVCYKVFARGNNNQQFSVRAKGETEESLLLRATRPEPLDDTRIEDLIASFLGPAQKLELLPEHELNFALHNFIEKDEKSAITEYDHFGFIIVFCT